MEGLRRAEFDGFDLTDHPEAELCALVTDEDTPVPVIVTILPQPRVSLAFPDHAVVPVDMRTPEASGGELEIVYMDPVTGTNECVAATLFCEWWDYAGASAFVIWP